MWPPLVCFLAALALYLITVRPDLVGGDPGEFQFVSWVLGIPHHTGYPLYTMVGWLWAQLPLGSVARRMNLFSTVFGAISVGLAAALAMRLPGAVPGRVWAGVVAGVALAVAPLDWHWATIAGVRAPAVAEVGWMLLAAVGVLAALEDHASRRADWGAEPQALCPRRRGRALAVLALACGVALAHHRSGALALPGIALALATDRQLWRVRWRFWLSAAVLFLVPLLSYAYLPIRARQEPPFHQWHPETLNGFLDLVLAIEHSRVHFAFPLSALPPRAELLYVHMRGEFGQAGLVLAVIGCLWLLASWPRAWIALAGYFALQSWQVLNWDVGPDQLNVVYELPAQLVVAVWIGLGALAIGWAAARVLPDRAWLRAAPVTVVAIVALGWLGVRGVQEARAQAASAVRPLNHDRSVLADGWAARRIVGGGLGRVEPNAVVVGDWEQATVVWYLQFVEGVKPHVQVNYPVENLGAALRDYPSRPVWLMARTAVPPDRPLGGDGPFVRVGRADEIATAPPPDTLPESQRFEDALELVGLAYGDKVGQRILQPDPNGDVLPVTLYWRALSATRRDLSVSVRLIDAVGRIAAQQDNSSPVLSLYPTSRWREGEVVGDYYELPYRALAPGEYRLEVRVYLVDSGGFRDLRVGPADHADATVIRR